MYDIAAIYPFRGPCCPINRPIDTVSRYPVFNLVDSYTQPGTRRIYALGRVQGHTSVMCRVGFTNQPAGIPPAQSAGIAIGSRVCVINIEGVDMWLVQEWRSPSVSSLKGALGEP